MGEVLRLRKGRRNAGHRCESKARKYQWLDTIKADPRADTYPHVGRRFINDLAEQLGRFPSFTSEGVYASRSNLAERLKVTPRHISRGLSALAALGYLEIQRRGERRTNLLVPLLDGAFLFLDRRVHNHWTSRSIGSGPPRPPKLLSLDTQDLPPESLNQTAQISKVGNRISKAE